MEYESCAARSSPPQPPHANDDGSSDAVILLDCAKTRAVMAALWIGQLGAALYVCDERVESRGSYCQYSVRFSEDVKRNMTIIWTKVWKAVA